jgi:hypothetical protein
MGYTAQKTKQGAKRSFMSPERIPNFVSFRDPHPGQNLRPPMLRMCLRKLLLSPDEFVQLLEDC